MYCKKCQKEIKDSAKFCPGCGVLISQEPAAEPEAVAVPKKKSNRLIAILAAVAVLQVAVIGGILLWNRQSDDETFDWKLEDGVLTISGHEKMPVWSHATDVPWYEERDTITEVVIEDGVTRIGYNAFSGCTSLRDVLIPDSVTSIGRSAFFNCTSLTEITIPEGVMSIGNSAFHNCTSLASVTIPDSVTSIGEGAFNWCTDLTEITIPDSVTSIGGYAFYLCTSLTDIYYTGTQEEWRAITIGEYNDDLLGATIHYNSAG